MSTLIRIRSAVAVGLTLVMAGFMFSMSARVARENGTSRQPEDLHQLTVVEADRMQRHANEVEALTRQIAALRSTTTSVAPRGPSTDVQLATGTLAVHGPGVTVTLDDAPADVTAENLGLLVVHQKDVQAVVNALWAGGAEAMTLQGQRVTPTSAFRCAGNILTLHGRVFSPPYAIAAIGDPQALRAALDASPSVKSFRDDARTYRLGWSVTDAEVIHMPQYEGTLALRYARPIS